jgi:hypothetical protein
MNEKEKETVASMLEASQVTLDAIRRLIEDSEISEDVKKKAFQKLKKHKIRSRKRLPNDGESHEIS